MSEDFYLSLPSHGNKDEFPNNRSNSFKICLPRPIRLEGSGWQVGLSAISLPDDNINLSRYKEIMEPLLRVKWYQLEDRKKDGDMGHVRQYHEGDISGHLPLREHPGRHRFFQSHPRQVRTEKERSVTSLDLLTVIGYVLDPRFRWEGEDLVMDNFMFNLDLVKSKIKHAQFGAPFEISFEKHVGVDFGWVSAKSDGTQTLGPNMRMEYHHLKYNNVVKYIMKNGSIGIMSGGRGKIKDIIKEGVV